MKDAADKLDRASVSARSGKAFLFFTPKVTEEHSHTCTFLGEGRGISLYPMLAPLSQPLFSGLSTVDKGFMRPNPRSHSRMNLIEHEPP